MLLMYLSVFFWILFTFKSLLQLFLTYFLALSGISLFFPEAFSNCCSSSLTLLNCSFSIIKVFAVWLLFSCWKFFSLSKHLPDNFNCWTNNSLTVEPLEIKSKNSAWCLAIICDYRDYIMAKRRQKGKSKTCYRWYVLKYI